MGRKQSLRRSACKLLPSGVASDALVEPHDIDCIQFNALDVGGLSTSGTSLVGADQICKGRKRWVVFQIRIDGILGRRILLKVVFVHNRILLCDLFFVRTRPALEKCLLVTLLNVVEEIVALLTELHLCLQQEGE